MLREWRLMFRSWLNDWLELALAPIRAVKSVRPSDVVGEVGFGIHQVRNVAADAVKHGGSLIAAIIGVVVRLPVNIVMGIVRAPSWTWTMMRSAPPRMVALVLVVAVTAVSSLGATAAVLWREHRIEARRTMYYRHLDYYLTICDIDEVEKVLVLLQSLAPDDPALAVRLDAVRTREAPFGDPKLLRCTMRTHFRESNFTLAAREAAKLVENFPTDWEARCMLADDAARRDDREAIQRNLSILPRALDVSDSIPPWVAWYSAALFHRLGETARFDEMVEFIVLNVLPLIKSRELLLLDPDARLLILECYRIALTQLDRRPSLVKSWAHAQIVCASLLDSEKSTARHWLSLATIQQMHLDFLQEFLRRKLISDVDYKASNAEIEDRLQTACERVIEREPKSAQAYVILAEHFFRMNKLTEAFATIDRGLQTCGGVTELVADKALLLRRTDPKASLDFLDRVVNVSTLNPMMCQVYSEVAWGAGRPDKALEACRQAQKQQPGLLWAHRREAEICMALGRPAQAATALGPVRSFLASDPAGCELYVKALCAAGSFGQAEDFLQQVAAENRPTEVLLKAAQGFAESRRLDDAVRWAKIALERDTTNPAALLIVGDCLRMLSEKAVRGWDRDMVRESLRAYRAVERQQPDNLTVINNIVWLELKALELPQQAFESSAPLRAVQDRVGLPADFMETLGAVYIAVNRYDDGRKMLTEALRTAGPRFGFYIHLALAHMGLKQPEMAEKYLSRAAEMPKSPRETAELVDTIRAIQQMR